MSKQMIHPDDAFDHVMSDLERVVVRKSRINTIVRDIIKRKGYENHLKDGWEWGWVCSDLCDMDERLHLCKYETYPNGGETEKERINVPLSGEPDLPELLKLFDSDDVELGGEKWEIFTIFIKKHKAHVLTILEDCN